MVNAAIFVDRAAELESPQKHRWQDSAECAQIGTDIFFPEKGQQYTIPKTICERCLVRSNCLEKVMSDEGSTPRQDRYGMVAGLVPQERWDLYIERGGKNEDEGEEASEIAA